MNATVEAKLKVKKGSAYEVFNGQVFPVLNFGDKLVEISLPDGTPAQFLHKELELIIYNKYNLDYRFRTI